MTKVTRRALTSLCRPVGLTWALSGLLYGWVALTGARPGGGPGLEVLLALLLEGQVALGCWLAARSPGLAPALRRFWRQHAAGFLLVTLGSVLDLGVQGAELLAATPGLHISPAKLLLCTAGVVIVLQAQVRLPLGRRTRSERVRFVFDAGTVMVAATVFAFHFAVGPRATELGLVASLSALLILAVVAAVAVFAGLKVAIGAAGVIERRVLNLHSVAAVGAGVCVAALALLDGTGNRRLLYAFVPLFAVPLVLAAARQRVVAVRGHERVPVRGTKRRFSLLPYASIASINVLLLAVAFDDLDGGGRLVVIGAVLLTWLVVTRQVAAFRENAGLLAQVDANERRFRSLVQHAADLIVIADADDRLVYASPAAEQMLGTPPGELLGSSLLERLHRDDLPAVREQLARLAGTPRASVTYRTRLARPDGSWRWLEVVTTNLLDDPSVGGLVSNARDVTQTREYEERLRHRALHDELTGLANRGLFADRVGQALGGEQAVTVLLADLDGFKAVNDSLGHAVGDAVLKAVAGRLRACVRPDDVVARLGGDEFAILLVGATATQAEATAGRVLDALAQPLAVAGHEVLVGASVGLAAATRGDDVDLVLREADVAMYAAKGRGKGGLVRYTTRMGTRMADDARLGAELRRGLDRDELHLLYQPIVRLPAGQVVGLEALVRWDHPTHGRLEPEAFLPHAERVGLAAALDRWVLRRACRQAAAWDAAGGAVPFVSVNVGWRRLLEPGYADEVTALLADVHLAPERLVVEVSETGVDDTSFALQTLRALRALGVRIALDDFGTGRSSLGLLAEAPVDLLKIDVSFVNQPAATAGDGVGSRGRTGAVAAAIVQLAGTLGMEAVAEGIQSAEQAAGLHALGCGLGQGFHFARPMPAADVRARLAGAASAGPARQAVPQDVGT